MQEEEFLEQRKHTEHLGTFESFEKKCKLNE